MTTQLFSSFLSLLWWPPYGVQLFSFLSTELLGCLILKFGQIWIWWGLFNHICTKIGLKRHRICFRVRLIGSDGSQSINQYKPTPSYRSRIVGLSKNYSGSYCVCCIVITQLWVTYGQSQLLTVVFARVYNPYGVQLLCRMKKMLGCLNPIFGQIWTNQKLVHT